MDRQFKELAETFSSIPSTLTTSARPSFLPSVKRVEKSSESRKNGLTIPSSFHRFSPSAPARFNFSVHLSKRAESCFSSEAAPLTSMPARPKLWTTLPDQPPSGLLGNALLSALEEDRFLDVRRKDGQRENRLLHQLRREENSDLWLFVCTGKNPESPDVDPSPWLRFVLKGTYEVTLYDTLTGEIREQAVSYQQGTTTLCRCWHMHDSMLLLLHPAKELWKKAFPPFLRPLLSLSITVSEPSESLLAPRTCSFSIWQSIPSTAAISTPRKNCSASTTTCGRSLVFPSAERRSCRPIS